MDEHYSWLELEQAREDVFRSRSDSSNSPRAELRPTPDDAEFLEALERMRDRLEDAPIVFDRRAVNAALRKTDVTAMHFRIQIVAVSDDDTEQLQEIAALVRSEAMLETLGLTLEESKQLLQLYSGR